MAQNNDAITRQVRDQRITSMIEAALIRPAMYTIGGSIPEVAAFLEGYFSGLAKDTRASDVVAEWADYVAFIGTEFDSAKWHDVFGSVATRFNSDVEAFGWLLSKYHQFKSSE